MNWEEYQKLACRTAPEGLTQLNVLLGIAGELGEVSELIKKGLYHGKKIEHTRLIEELGDVLWYCAAGAQRFFPFAPPFPKRARDLQDLGALLLDALRDSGCPRAPEFAYQFVETACCFFGLDIGDVMRANIEKLRERWPNGFGKPKAKEEEPYDPFDAIGYVQPPDYYK